MLDRAREAVPGVVRPTTRENANALGLVGSLCKAIPDAMHELQERREVPGIHAFGCRRQNHFRAHLLTPENDPHKPRDNRQHKNNQPEKENTPGELEPIYWFLSWFHGEALSLIMRSRNTSIVCAGAPEAEILRPEPSNAVT